MFNMQKPVSAKMSGSTLVVSFKKSTPPLIWKFDLKENHSFTVALQGEYNDMQLGVNSSRGEFTPIAHFNDRDAAEEAFMALQEILLKSQRSVGKTVLAVLGGLFIFLLIIALFGKIFSTIYGNGNGGGNTANGHVEMKQGVPLPADKVLQPPPLVPTQAPATQPSRYP